MWDETWKNSWKFLGGGKIKSWSWYIDGPTKTNIWEKDRVKKELYRSSIRDDLKHRYFLNNGILWGLVAKKGIKGIKKFVKIWRNKKLEKIKKLKKYAKEAGQNILASWFEEWLWKTQSGNSLKKRYQSADVIIWRWSIKKIS